MSELTRTVGVVGARGYVGDELVRLLTSHPSVELTLACSAGKAGSRVAHAPHLRYLRPDPLEIARECPDVLVLAMPNGKTEPLLTALEAAGDRPELLVDVSADARFKDDWLYSVPELQAERLRGVNRIANPGCYATAMQLALAPIVDRLAAVPHCFGVSGYSGAGSKPGPNNDVERLEGGVRPYGLNGHIHEREVSRQLGIPVRFAPSVAPFFRGIVLTALCEVDVPMTAGELSRFYRERYADAPLVRILGEEMPRVQEVVGTPHAFIGGLGVDPNHPRRISVVCTIDNLLKGAASQAVQNFNLALGIDPLTGLV